jgi:ferric enterobactin receptor
MNQLTKALFMICICSVMQIQSLAQSNTTRNISGIVKNADSGERLPFADILIQGENRGTSTNVDGYFSLFNVPTDSFRLEIMYVGFQSIEYFVAAGKDNIENLTIELSSGIALTEVTINANSFKIMNASEGVSTVRLSPAKLALLPNVGEVDIFRSLQLLPGISGSNESSSGLFIRGGTPDQNLVLFDGMTVYNVDHFFGFFSAFNADAVKDVQLFKGAFPAKYGGRLSGVVDLTGKTGSTDEFHADIGLNLLSSKVSVQIPIFKKASLLICGRRSYTDIIRSGVYNKIFDVFTQGGTPTVPDDLELTINTIEPDFYFYDFNAKLSFQPTKKDVISLSFYNGKDNLVEENDVIVDIPLGGSLPDRRLTLDIDEFTNWGNRGTSLKWSRQWNAKWYSNVLLAYSNYFSVYDRTIDLELSIPDLDSVQFQRNLSTYEDNNVQDLTFRLDNELQLSDKHKVDFGILGTRVNLDYILTRDDTLNILNQIQEGDNIAIYLQESWQPHKSISINAGIRATYYSLSDKIYYSPRFTGEWNLSEKLKFKTGLGRHFQFVNRVINESITEGSRDFWLLADDDLVQVSHADHYVVGASYPFKGFIFDVEAYYKKYYNLAEFSLRFQRADTEVNELFFNGNGYSRGMEFLVQKAQGQYTAWASYTLAEVIHTFVGLNDGLPFPALHDTRHEFKMVHSYEHKKWTFATTYVFASGKPYTEPDGQYTITMLDGSQNTYISVGRKNGTRLPYYSRLDFSATCHFDIGRFKGSVSASVFNFFNRENIWYREFDFSQTPGVITDIRYLGVTPNLAVYLKF